MTENRDAAAAQGAEASKSEDDWRAGLTDEQFRVLRQKGTERAFTGAYWDHHDDGVYRCAGCHAKLFDSRTKFESGSGWPSFYDAIDDDAVTTETDTTHGMVRTEVLCRACGGHLGHVFPDGPRPTGQRFCINSASLQFDPDKA